MAATRILDEDPSTERSDDRYVEQAWLVIDLINACITILGPEARGFLTKLTTHSGETREARMIRIRALAALCLLDADVDVVGLERALAVLRGWGDPRVLVSTIAWLRVMVPADTLEAVLTTREFEKAATLGPG